MISSVSTTPAQHACQWRRTLAPERRSRSIRRGLTIFVLSASLYVVTFIGMFLLPHPLARAAMMIAQPLIIGGLFVIGHDAAHNSLTRLGWLNRLLARISFLPAWHPFTSWAFAHNTLHHGWTSFKGREPAFPPFTKAEFDKLSSWRRRVERFYRSPIGIGFYYTIDFYLKHLIVPRGRSFPPFRTAFDLDRLLVFAFLVLQVFAAWELTALTPNLVLPHGLYCAMTVFIPWMTWILVYGLRVLSSTHASAYGLV